MVEGVEGVGEAVVGGMAARTVEPRAGEGGASGGACLNCGTGLIGDYCHRCGQSGNVRRTLRAFGHDIAHSALHFDGKVWRTLPLLAWKPGELTRRYIAGERVRFVSPMALFLFSVFLMFAVVSLIGGPIDLGSGSPAYDREEMLRDLQAEHTEAQARLGRLEAELRAARAAGRPTAPIERQIASVREEIAVQERAGQVAVRMANEEEAREAPARGAARGATSEPQVNLIEKTGWEPLDRAVAKAENNPSLLLYKVQNNAYKFSWALIPLSAPFLWMMFLHRRRYRQYRLYDHTVFVTYSIAFMSLGAVMLSVLRPLGMGQAVTGLAFTFIPPIHMYRQLRGAYLLSRWSALWRTVVLLISASIAASLFLVLLLMLGVLG